VGIDDSAGSGLGLTHCKPYCDGDHASSLGDHTPQVAYEHRKHSMQWSGNSISVFMQEK
jgi:CDGSH-type Zn-finger protein